MAEATAGSFEDGGCKGNRRGLGEGRPRRVKWTLPADGYDTSVKIGYAEKFGPVSVTTAFILKGAFVPTKSSVTYSQRSLIDV